ncbi:MAG: polysaccharide biosynthesis/export family protein [Desulfohalobiaceae bacterium]
MPTSTSLSPSRGARILAMVLLVLFLSGCSIVPGFDRVSGPYAGKDSGYHWDSRENRWVKGSVPDNATIPEITPITPDLILKQHRQGQESEEARSPQPKEEVDYAYTIGPNDVLSVIVWGHPDLSNPMGAQQSFRETGRRVSADGTIFYPYAGSIQVAGLTTEQVRQKLMRKLAPYIDEPQVSVRVVGFESKKTYITGAVKKPGTQPITSTPLTVMDAINQAGGLIPQGSEERVGSGQKAILTRDGERYIIDIQDLYSTGEENFLLRDGDVLYVQNNRENKVFVLGEVNRQTSVRMNKGELTLAEALSQAEWFDLERANTGGVYVIRGVPQERSSDVGGRTSDVGHRTSDNGRADLRVIPRIYQLDASAVSSLILADRFRLQPRDVIYVASSGLVPWNRFVNQILPTVTTIYRLDRLVR